MLDPRHRVIVNADQQVSTHATIQRPGESVTIPEQYNMSNSQSIANVETEIEPPNDIDFHRALEAIVMSGVNDLILRLYAHADGLHDIRQIEHHTVLIPTKEAFLNLGEEACAALETEEGKPHLAAIFRHNMFAHEIKLQDTGLTIVVDGLDRGSTVDICSLDDNALPFRLLMDSNTSILSISDDYSTADVEMDAYHLGRNIIHITDRVLLPISAAHFLGIDMTLRDVPIVDPVVQPVHLSADPLVLCSVYPS